MYTICFVNISINNNIIYLKAFYLNNYRICYIYIYSTFTKEITTYDQNNNCSFFHKPKKKKKVQSIKYEYIYCKMCE